MTCLPPALIDYEITNALHLAIVRRRFDCHFAKKYFRLFQEINLTRQTPDFSQVLILAQEHRLSAYDASYLELSLRLKLPLYSLDKKLIALAGSG